MQLRWASLMSVRSGVFLAAAVAFALTHWVLGFWSVDDAGITYAYSVALADRGSLSPLPESMPVEGYSNPLLFLFIALLRLLHLFDPITTHTKIELVAFAMMALLVHELLRAHLAKVPALVGTAIFVALELLTPSTWLWYRSGLENVIVSLALITLLFVADRAVRRGTFNPILIGVLCFLVALIRPEAPVYVAAFYIGALLLARPPDGAMRAHLLRLVVAGTITAALYIGFVMWRHTTYGVWFPNTYFAKLDGGPTLLANITDYLIPVIFPYGNSLLFALAVVVLAMLKPFRPLAILIGLFTVASLVMPSVGGKDMMGEHRFATTFFAMSHVAAASLVAAICASETGVDSLARRLLLAMILIPIFAFTIVRVAGGGPTINTVTTAKVVELHGVRRMQHQRRLGVINPVVIAPDAGGVLLFGSLQHIDNGYLTDFQMAHMLRLLTVMTQYQTVERMADLADTNPTWGTFDRRLVGQAYLAPLPEEHMFARRDLVELEAAPSGDAFYDELGLRLYVSPENVLVAGPRGLVRIGVAVAWDNNAAVDGLRLLGSISGDNDSIPLAPYGGLTATAPASGTQRRALLLGAPQQPGVYDVTFELRRGEEVVWTRTVLKIEVLALDRMQTAVDAILHAPGATRDLILRRFAWLREQSIPRLSHVALRREQLGLVEADVKHTRRAARRIRKLTWDARLASLTDEVPPAIRAAEQGVVDGVLNASTCPAIDGDPGLARQALCIGRHVDRLRRYGYFGVLGRMPDLRKALLQIRTKLRGFDRNQRYVALVGIYLAMPERVDVNKALVTARDRFANQGTWPSLDL